MFKVVLNSILSQTISDTAKIIYIQFFNDVVAVKPEEGILKLPAITQLSTKLHIRKNNIQPAINELVEAELLELFPSEETGKTNYQLRFYDADYDCTTSINDPGVWSDRDGGATSQYYHNPYTIIPDAFFYSNERVETKIKYCMFSACLRTAHIKSFSASIIKRFIPDIPARTARSALLKLEELGWISLELVDPSNCRLGYKKISFWEAETHVDRAKAHIVVTEEPEVTEEPIKEENIAFAYEGKNWCYVEEVEEVEEQKKPTLGFKIVKEPEPGTNEYWELHPDELDALVAMV